MTGTLLKNVKNLRLTLGLIILSTWRLGAETTGAQPPLEDFLPPDTLAYVRISDAATLDAKLENNPLLEADTKDQLRNFFEPLLKRLEDEPTWKVFEEETGFNLEEFKEQFKGPFGMALLKMTPDHERAVNLNGVFVAEYKGNHEILEQFMTALRTADAVESNAEIEAYTEETFLGTTLFIQEDATGGFQETWTLLNERQFIIGDSVEVVKEIVARLTYPEDFTVLSEQSVFQKTVEAAGDHDVLCFFNFSSFVPALSKILEEATGNTDDASYNIMGITPQSLMDALALDVLESLFCAISIEEDHMRIDGGLIYSEDRGLVSLLAYTNEEVGLPEFVPPDVLAATVSNFSFSQAFENLEALLVAISPILSSVYQAQLQHIQAQTGIDIRQILVDSLGKQYLSYSAPSKPGNTDQENDSDLKQDEVFAISIEDSESIQLALSMLQQQVAPGADPFDKRDYLGFTIHTLKPQFQPTPTNPNDAKIFAYALTNDHLFLTFGVTTKLLEATLSLVQNTGALSFWERPDIQDAFSQLPRYPVQRDYSDIGVILRMLFKLGVDAQGKNTSFEIVNPEALPPMDAFPFSIISTVYRKPEGLLSSALLLKKEALEN